MESGSTTQRVAAEVRAGMARRRITQMDVAEHLGVSQAAVSRRLRGDVPFDVEELGAIAALLEVPVATFLDQPEQVSA